MWGVPSCDRNATYIGVLMALPAVLNTVVVAIDTRGLPALGCCPLLLPPESAISFRSHTFPFSLHNFDLRFHTSAQATPFFVLRCKSAPCCYVLPLSCLSSMHPTLDLRTLL
ncbi:hypothetical protein B0O80DRAFT_456977 [Mortierella sp. GBAus27b]|nr:hypothetical protein B0O80DRAFT_456977 [Mortierella sp. GBAus27b]